MSKEQIGFSQVLTELGVLKESLRNTNVNVNEMKSTISVALDTFVRKDLLDEKLKTRDEKLEIMETAQTWTTRAIWAFLVILAGFGVYVIQLKLSVS